VAVRARYLADRSALSRMPIPIVAARLRPLLEDGDVATCSIIDLEVLYSSRNLADYEAIRAERLSFQDAPITPEVMDLAIELQHELARCGQHRIAIADLIISAAAKQSKLIVLHFDRDFERIAAVGGAPQEWVVPTGSV